MSARRSYVPPGWPKELPPPGAAEFDERVGAWLLDHCPPDTRAHDALRNQPRVLAGIAVMHADASLTALRAVYRQARVSVLADLEPREATAALSALEALGARLAQEQREVVLVATALGVEQADLGELLP